MTLSDKIAQVTGQSYSDQTNHGATGIIPANARLCIPALALNDAGAGLGDQQTRVTAFPDGIAQTAAWDRSLARRYGRALGTEAFTKGINVILAPGVDIARTPLNGRNFEYAGEDPYLAGQAAASIIGGIQSRHVIATVKHYAVNDQETNRMSADSVVGERAMEEIHLPAFRAAVQQGHVGSVMCSYNRVNARYACQNRSLLRHYLNHQMHFTGWVMSDWLATHSTVRSAKAGLDMEMPVGQYYGDKLKSAVQSHQVPLRVLNEMVHRILFTMFRIGLFDHVPAEGTDAASANASTPASKATARRVAEEGSVLLKNASRVLPLTGHGKTIAVIGDAAAATAPMAAQGYGSGHVPEAGYQAGVVSPLQAIQNRAGKNGDTVTYASSQNAQVAAATAKTADVAVVFVNDVETEGADRPDLVARSGTCTLVGGCTYDNVDQNALVSAVAAANKRTVVVVQSGGPIMMPWLGKVAGVLENWYPGQVDGSAVAPLLFGDVNPSGKLPVTFPRKLSDGPVRTRAQYPGVTNKNGVPQVHYREGLLVGYRWYQARHIAPLFPFGYGLSYTTFRFSRMHVHPNGRNVVVTVRLTNTGKRPGAQVAQVYVHQPARTGEPPHQLQAFRRVQLKPGSSVTVQMVLGSRAFAHWDTQRHAWRVAAGCFGIGVGPSSGQLPLHARLPRGGGSC
ncbi:MAG TPA: glycoside hydrolase family 3 C-terminal domain-containing protein [Jatrophihabitans sp.]